MKDDERNKISYERAMNLTVALQAGEIDPKTREATNFLLAEIAVQMFVTNAMLNELLEKESAS